MEKCSNHKEDGTNAILAFDTLYTTNHMKILKLLLPYLEAERQKKLAIFIKWQEFVFTLHFFKHYPAGLYPLKESCQAEPDLGKLLSLLTPYCSESEKTLLSQLNQMLTTMDWMNEMQQYLPLIQEFMSMMSQNRDSNEAGNGANDIMELLKNMMSEEQQAMFSMFMDNIND